MGKKLHIWLIFLIFLNGYISLSLELLILRQLSFYVGSSAVITSIIMGVFLGFMSFGYFLGSSERIGYKRIRNVLNISFLCIALLAFLSSTFPLITDYFSLMYQSGIRSSIIQTFIFSFVFLSWGPFLFGFNTTLLSRCLHKYNTNYTGSIMAWDTIGSVLGSLLTTLILMPFIGVNYTVILVVSLSCLAALMIRQNWVTIIFCLTVIIPCFILNTNYYQYKRFGILVNNANSTISVSDYGNDKVLYMNSLPMSIYNTKTGKTADYINYINDNFVYSMPRWKMHKILVLGAGGFTVGLNDNFNYYTFVDIERDLKDISEKHFLKQKLSSNKRFVVQDASQFLKNTNEKYDLIILDVYSNSFQIPEGFITIEFMERLKSKVADNGIIVMNVIAKPDFSNNFSQVFDNTFHKVFTKNTQRQVIGYISPWERSYDANILYIYYNRDNEGRVYTINKTPVIYDR